MLSALMHAPNFPGVQRLRQSRALAHSTAHDPRSLTRPVPPSARARASRYARASYASKVVPTALSILKLLLLMAVIMGGTTAFLHFGRLEGASDAVARSEVEASRDDALFLSLIHI